MAGWTCSDNDLITWDGTIKARNFVVENNLNLLGMTAGSVLFADTNGLVSQDNTNLFWNSANSRLGVGTTLPTNRFTVSTAGNSVTAGVENLAGYSFSSITTNGQGVGWGFGTGSDIANNNVGAKIVHIRRGSQSMGDLAFYTKPNTSAGDTTTEKMRILSTGEIGIGTTSPSHLLDVASQAAITSYGGFATKFKLGAVASGGWIVRASPASEGYVVPCGIGDGLETGQDMPIGAIYHTTASTAVNSDVWVVHTGKAKVQLDAAAECSYGYFLRTSDTVSGAVLASTEPTVPADASHWREIGHSTGHANAGSLVPCILHFN